MITNNRFYIDLLRELWESDKDHKTVTEFCNENKIKKTFFYAHVGTKKEVLKRDKYIKTRQENVVKYNKFETIEIETLSKCKSYFREGKDFKEISDLTGVSEWVLMQALIDEWQDRQIEKNTYSKNNLYEMSIADMFEKGFSDKDIAYMFSVDKTKIRNLREKLCAKQ